MENIVFYFSGTGNSLKVAKTIANKLENGKIISMAKNESYNLTGQYDSIGFVYPTYFGGLPNKVYKFINNIIINNDNNVFFYAITTYGGFLANGLSQIDEIFLNKHNLKINYGQKIVMVPNYIVKYNWNIKISKVIKRADKKTGQVIESIKNKENKSIKKHILYKYFDKYYWEKMKQVPSMDKDYNINSNCTVCGICEEVCPVKNIEIINKIPQFKHNCEQCVACIQYCPQKAINYKDITQNRRRYTNPEINYKEL